MDREKIMDDIWTNIWEKSIAMAKSYRNWKIGKASVNTFSRRKTDLYNEVMKILEEIN